MTACFMLAGTVDDSHNMLMIFLTIGANVKVLASRIADGSGSISDVLIMLLRINDVTSSSEACSRRQGEGISFQESGRQ